MVSVNKKVYIMDFGNHYKQIMHSARLYNFDGEVRVVCTKNQKAKYCSFLSSDRIDVVDSIPSVFSLFFKFFFASKFVLLTGPFYGSKLKNTFSSIFLFLVFLGRHVLNKYSVIYVKDIRCYTKGGGVNKASLHLVDNVFFESESLTNLALTIGVGSESKNRTSYVYFSDTLSEQARCSNVDISLIRAAKQKGYSVVGVIGQFDSVKRDYSWLKKSELKKVFFVQVGRFVDSTDNQVCAKQLQGVLHFLQADFSNDDLDCVLLQCDVLLSLNTSDLGYDKYKGTAAFGEAISVSKPLVIPSFCDLNLEFEEFSFYYDSEQSFDSSLAAAIDFGSSTAFDYFTVEEVRKRLFE
ncbi:hypothetical protein [Agarivorans sp. Z349TD_8]|uniref:hypothetical protein n=1 Tax=Agarivorans sp. Z349TD_8 TaxID=3421434 RepID=UPI003D7CF525